jgi:DNA polymerase-3 subunit delta'
MWQVFGQPKAITLLERSIQHGQLSHAHLFVGPPHVGKFTLAVNLAQAVNCESSEDVPCQQCPACLRIAAGKHADVQIVDLISPEAKEIGINQIKEIQMSSHLPPFEGKRKVFIIDKAELLSNEAANCLLKTLEEPPPKVHLILLTASESRLLTTILSRCQRVELRPLPASMVREILITSYDISHDRAVLLSTLSGGCLGWALLADSDDTILQHRQQTIAAFADLSSASLQQRFAYAAEMATQFSKSRHRVTEILSSWLQWWHDLLLIKGGNAQSITNIDCKAMLSHQAEGLTIKQIAEFIRHIEAVGQKLEQNVSPRAALEVLMLKMPQARMV